VNSTYFNVLSKFINASRSPGYFCFKLFQAVSPLSSPPHTMWMHLSTSKRFSPHSDDNFRGDMSALTECEYTTLFIISLLNDYTELIVSWQFNGNQEMETTKSENYFGHIALTFSSSNNFLRFYVHRLVKCNNTLMVALSALITQKNEAVYVCRIKLNTFITIIEPLQPGFNL